MPYSPAATPKTGDDSNILLLCALVVTSGTAAVLWLEVIRRRRPTADQTPQTIGIIDLRDLVSNETRSFSLSKNMCRGRG